MIPITIPRTSLLILLFNLFRQVAEVDPPVHLLLQLPFQASLLLLKLLEGNIVAGAFLLPALHIGQLLLQSGNLSVDGLILPLLLVAEFQLLGALRPLLLFLSRWSFGCFGLLLRLPGGQILGVPARIGPDHAVRLHGEHPAHHLVQENRS